MTRKEIRELRESISITGKIVSVIKKYFPKLLKSFKTVEDKRNKSYIKYSVEVILFVQILGHIAAIESMNQMGKIFNRSKILENVNEILKTELKEMPHYDTVNDVLKKISFEEMREILKEIIYEMIRKKMFDKYRIRGKFFQIIFDGSGLFKFKERHCKHCLKKEYKNKETGEITYGYYHQVLEAKLCVGDMVFSIDTEFIENEDENVKKQDCEINAFKRMEKRLKKYFPRLPIIVSGDALYSCKPIIDICKANKWEYILRFKTGTIPTLGQEIDKMEHNNLLETSKKVILNSNGKPIKKAEDNTNKKIERTYKFTNEIHVGEATKSNKGYEVNVLKFYESKIVKGKERTTEFTWITSIKINEKNAEEVAHVGRKRWKIENEGFKDQKCNTFHIEHLYSKNPNAMKIHYLLIQIAHMIRQLLMYGSAILREAGFTRGDITDWIREEWVTIVHACNDIEIWRKLRVA